MLLNRVSQDQETAEDGVEEEDLLVWYLEQIEEDLTSQEDVEGQKGLAKKVLRRMVKDNVLMQIRGEGLADEEGEGLEQSDRVMYVVHPNCPIDE
ncbi:hypothetical protein KC332_g14999 [Hortaea werneckii]|nr:hypothetical protein KC350_g18471 [Hortaea werneckii]KAI6803044.1 hypothetical protein KC358_g15031 [Hortaea werneckii]KAI6905216.1 hypothetical protein KC348_g15032 [Hortaea werneckii]KAI6923309.1 hypothetical protein KC341_g14825 [Hortaea werneckii]KAI6956763.1 hypothetical protein KC321_g14973 [Hortaea werneckii]